MKKYLIYFSHVSIIAIAFSFSLFACKEKKRETKQAVDNYQLLSRKTGLVQTAEWNASQNNASMLLQKVKQNPADIKSLLMLTSLYLQEARISGNYQYYNSAALNCIDQVLQKDARNFEAVTFKAMILLSQHHFAEGLAVAEHAKEINPYNSFVYGLLLDANVEMGHYEKAVACADKMVSIRPDNRSYSRIAYLREIYGDLDGAIDAMKLAIEAGSPGDENTEWSRIQLGKLYEKKGDITNAEIQYQIALNNRPNYPYALAGLARAATCKKEYNTALHYYMQADTLLNDHTFKEGMIEIYTLTGKDEKAEAMAVTILNCMQQVEKRNEGGQGQNETHEMAHAYMGIENFDKALEYALMEYNSRPENIEVNETAALVYYRKGDYVNALKHIQTALKTNCNNPELLCHAGLIYAKTGGAIIAKRLLLKALKNNPFLPVDLEKESREILNELS
jgi:tetratricopeptide (TPR) repeat protein